MWVHWYVRELLCGASTPIRDLPIELTELSEVSQAQGKKAKHTRKFPEIRDWDQAKPSVHRLMPLSSTLKMKIAPLLTIVRRSKSFKRRVTLGIRPLRAA